ncbi:hypothetical protein LPJ77_000636 [Coemansia sp. RSA 2523]|nr:hypothetical protein LPJ54_000027 [Coemansia sp. RSA 1824]KAJ1810745.1 hypothetical protein LPJ77_000636 [Coemansia sp. RSA 2523]KAJ2153575.1 hypothetical protein J3F82_001863 [Coemansia sp. RSA 637]KAJ2205423.1 hypothetical protein IW145_002808 [Coemansia sp. RSA 521]KAJ2220303.1 hypothetical protein EV180_005052 [Coemansia sp. RSA 518]KAJ2258092.1 hypothetical protein GGH98_000394 [Coemansia sp. RSA 454]KAJ2268327.1 hypothetical protein J3F81_004741 [Coemansia sp. RSA 371]KAJ2270840.1 h
MDSDSESTDSQQRSESLEFHDEDADTRDADWMNKEHPGHTDAVLACPMCFTQVCFVCQKHERFAGQYRALSVTHCEVQDVLYSYGKNGLLEPIEADHSLPTSDVFRLVCCAECHTKLGVIDSCDAYHLFHVLDDPPVSL